MKNRCQQKVNNNGFTNVELIQGSLLENLSFFDNSFMKKS